MNPDPSAVSLGENNPIEAIVTSILSEISQQYKLDISQDPVAVERIREAVVKAKLELETDAQVEIDLPFISATSSGPIHYKLVLTNADFEKSISNTIFPHQDQEPIPVQTRIKLPDQKPIITTILMVVTGLIYAIQLLTGYLSGYDIPAALGLKVNELIIAGQYWRLVTPVFLHGSILHLGFNMYALYILGRRMERFYGSFRFLGLYLIAGITGNLLSFLLTEAPSLGSSTAIFGLLGAEGIFIYQHRKLFGDQSRTALRQIIQVAGINLLIGLSPGIDNWGHIGGLIGGLIFAELSGPRFQIKGSYPEYRLDNEKTDQSAGFGFLLQLSILVGLIYLSVLFRGQR